MNSEKWKQGAIAVAVALFGLLAAVALVASKPKPPRAEPVDNGVLVETMAVRSGTERFSFDAQGVVIPARQVTVQPQVAGRVVEINENLVPGGIVRAGELLYRVDPSDYELNVASQQTALAQAEAQFELEKGRQRIARQEWELFAGELDGTQRDPALALREPQLRAAQATVDAARARLSQAELNLQRTAVRAPFNAYVRSESVDLGQTVSVQNATANLVGTDRFWVQTSIPAERLAMIKIAADGNPGSAAMVGYDYGTRRLEWAAEVVRLLGDMDRAGQMARVLVAVHDPLGLAPHDSDTGRDRLPLLLDSYVSVRLESNHEQSVFVIPRDWLHNGDRVFVNDSGVLEIRDVDIVWRREQSVLVAGGLADGDEVITSPIATPIAGMLLRRADTASAPVAQTATETPRD